MSKVKAQKNKKQDQEEDIKEKVQEEQEQEEPQQEEENYYEFLGVEKTATESEIKKAYYKKAVKYHPDRAEGDKEEAKKLFQKLNHIYNILSNPKLRDIYDKVGEVNNDELNGFNDRDWDDYCRSLYPKISRSSIIEFEKNYRESEEERKDILEAYTESKGDMTQILDSVFFATIDDEERFRSIIEEAVEKKEVPSFKKFFNEDKKKKAQRKSKAKKEAKEAEELAKELGLDKEVENEDQLTALIQNRNENKFQNMIAHLEQKYGGKENKKKTSRKRQADEDSEPNDHDEIEEDEPSRKKRKVQSTQNSKKRKVK